MTEQTDTEGLVLETVGAMPFLSRGELAPLCGLSDGEARHGLDRLLREGLLERVGHARRETVRTRRFHLTRAGIEELARRRGVAAPDLLEALPLSAEWRAILLRRLDTAETYYRLAALAAVVSGRRCSWHWRRSGWLDGTLEIGPGRYVRICRIGSAVPRRSVLSRLGGMVAAWRDGFVDTALLIVPGHTQARLTERWLREHANGVYAWVVTEPDLFLACPHERTWRRPAEYRTRAYAISQMLSGVGERCDEHGDDLLRPGRHERSTLPGEGIIPSGRQADLLPATLTKGQKDLLDLVADWPLMRTADLARMLGVSDQGVGRYSRALIRLGLVHSLGIKAPGAHARDAGDRMCLGDAGLRLLCWRDRTKLHAMRARWGVSPQDEGRPEFVVGGYRLDGGRLRQLAGQMRHTDGVHRFVSLLAEACRSSEDAQLLEALPSHRSERWFVVGGRYYGVRPDASGVVRAGRAHVPFLLEYEERATTPTAAGSRLDPYRRYYDVLTRVEDWGRHPALLVVFGEAADASRFAAHCARNLSVPRTFSGDRLPLYVCSVDDLVRTGVLGKSWLRPHDLDAGRVSFLDRS